MFKIAIKHFAVLFYCMIGLVGLLLFAQFQGPTAHAAPTAGSSQLTISLPNNAPLAGHPGTKIHLRGQGFTPGVTLAFYTTTNGDKAKCISAGDPQGLGLTPFPTQPTPTIMPDKSFDVDTTWPSNAANATTPYYVCVTSSDGSASALSTQPFTVAQAASIDTVTPASVNPGAQVTITGSNWLPVQALSVTVLDQNNAPIAANPNVTPKGDGSFSVVLTIPATAQPGNYSVKVIAPGEPTQAMTVVKPGLTIAAAPTPTPTATAAPTATATAAPTATATAGPTATATPGSGSANNTGMNILVFALGGLGVLLVVVGITVFTVYSRKH